MDSKKTGAAGNSRIRMKYFPCLRGGDHEGELLNYVCVKRDCPNRGLLCSICKLEHQGHSIVSLKGLLTNLRTHTEKPLESSEGFQNEL